MCLLMLLCCSIDDVKAENYWWQLRKAADRCYSGFDLDVSLELGVRQNDEDINFDMERYGKFVLKAPMLSLEKRVHRNTGKIKFLESGVDLIRQIEEAEELIKQNKAYIELLEKIAYEEGVEVLEKAIKINAQVIELQNQRRAAIRKLEGYFNCCEKLLISE
jgi:hypothetical protein